MQIFEELNNLISEALELEQIDEKIMSKKQAARKRKLRAKRRAEKRAQQAKQTEETKIDEPVETDSQESENEEETKENNFEGSTALIVYKEPEKENYTQEFLDFVKKILELTNIYQESMKKAVDGWKSLGEDKPISEDLHTQMVNAIETYSGAITNLYDNELPMVQDKMHLVELEFLQAQFQAITKYIEKQGKYIYSLEPQKMLADNGTQSTELQKIDQETKQLDDKNKKKTQLIPYKGFIGEFLNIQDKFKKWYEGLNDFPTFEQMSNEVKAFLAGNASKLLGNVQAIISIPVVDGFIKTLMYSNPWTAAIYDGKFGKIDLKGHLDKINAEIEKRRQKEGGEAKYDEKGIITVESLASMSKRKLRIEYECNKTFAALVNLCYNHSEVDKEDKADLLKNTKKLNKLFASEDGSRDEVVKYFTSLLDTVNKICKYMKWNKKNIIIRLIDDFINNRGNTEKEQKSIEDKASKKNDTYQELKNKINKYWNTLNDQGKYKYTKEQIKDMMLDAPEKYREDDINTILNSLKREQQESYSFTSNLIRLLEAAEA